jgi:hypothetical protein
VGSTAPYTPPFCRTTDEAAMDLLRRTVLRVWAMNQTKPECARKEKGSKNVIGRSSFHGRAGGARRTRAEVPLGRDQDDPMSRYISSASGDLLSWLGPENVALTSPRLFESEDIESWIEAIVARWEKQHGPIPRKEVMPHEIATGGSSVGPLSNKTGMSQKTNG